MDAEGADTVRRLLASPSLDDSPAAWGEPLQPWQVIFWRMSTLLDAGYTGRTAAVLATDPSVDLHVAVDLLGRGCPADTAMRILV